MTSNAEKENATGFLASIIEQANTLRNRLDEMPAELWADAFSIICQADSLMDDALDLLDTDVSA